MKYMRILQVVLDFPPSSLGGTGIYTLNLSLELSKTHEIYVLYLKYGGFSYSINFSKRNGLNIYRLNIPYSEEIMRLFNFRETYIDLRVEKKFIKLLSEIKPDCIHFQHLLGLSASLLRIAKEKDIPAVLTLHDYWFICPTTRLFKSNSTICNGSDEKSENCFKCWNNEQSKILANIFWKSLNLKIFPEKLLESLLMKINPKKKFSERKEYMTSILLNTDILIAPSHYVKNIFLASGISEPKIICSNNGYNLNVFEGFKKKKHRNLILGFTGNVLESKGVGVLIDAFNMIDVKDVELKIFGGFDSKGKYFKSLQTKKGKNNIKFMGKFYDFKIPYSEIDILVVPSLAGETGGPLVVKEAFITGTPVIASNIGCIPESVVDGFNGLLFEPGNARDLAKKIKKLIDNPYLVYEFQKNLVLPRSLSDQTIELEEIYTALICKYALARSKSIHL
jgi:glycosyltransferase involved in cell wall biosynthesis